MNPRALDGVRFLDHTADVGIAVAAPTLEALFHRAALGMLALLRGDDDPDHPAPDTPSGAAAPSVGRPETSAASPPAAAPDVDVADRVAISGEGPGRGAVLAAWLRELLFLHEVEHRDYRDARFERLDESGFDARVRSEPSSPAVREIKGVTYHDLVVERAGTGWRARVIFDV